MTVSEICKRGEMVGKASASSFAFGVLEILGMLSILIYLRYSQVMAQRGQISSLVLPVYYIIVLYEIVIGLLVGIDSVSGFYYENVYLRGLKWLLFQSVSEGIAVLFLHNGVGIRAFRNAIIVGLGWGIVSSLIPIIFYRISGFQAYSISIIVFLSLMLVFYLACWLLPQRLLHRRPAMVHLSRFYVFTLCIFLIGYIIALSSGDNSNCIVAITFALADFCLPFVVLRALREDSFFWQGLYDNVAASNLNQPLMGMWDFNQKTLTMVTDTICTLERKVVMIIPFGNLTLDTSRFFSGGSARVYRGRYKNNAVAIKMLFCIELTPERLIEFCNEASLLYSLQHPHVVTCYGVSVMPPAMCLVTEFCDVGSLYDFLHSEDASQVAATAAAAEGKKAKGRYSIFRSNSNKKIEESASGISRLVSAMSNSSSSQANSVDFSNSEINSNPLLQAVRRPSETTYLTDRRSLTARPNEFGFGVAQSGVSDIEVGSVSASNNSTDSKSRFANSLGTHSSELQGVAHSTSSNSNNANSSNTNSNSANTTTNRQSFQLSGSFNTPLMERSGSFVREFLGYNPDPSVAKRAANSSLFPSQPEMKPASAVMTSRAMGYGLGPAEYLTPSSASKISGSFKIAFPDRDLRKSHSITMESFLAKSRSSRFVSGSKASSQSELNVGGMLLPVALRTRFARDCCAGIAYLHSCGFIHCDVKSLNFLVTSELVIKLSDLGEARKTHPDASSHPVSSLPRNINWSPPEVMRGETNVEPSSDVWSLALVISEIMSGEVPFDTEEVRKLSVEAFLDRVQEGMRPNLPYFVSDIPHLAEMLQQAWNYVPRSRCSATQLLAVLESAVTPISQDVIKQFQRFI